MGFLPGAEPGMRGDAGCVHPAPPEPFADERSEACWDVPNAPTAEFCPASAAEELGEPCCLPGACAFDFGAGCTYEPEALTGDVAPNAAVCAGGAFERVFGADIERIALGREALFMVFPEGDQTRVTRVAKDSCEARVIHDAAGPLGALQIVGDVLYVVAGFSGEQLLAIEASGSATEIVVAALLDAASVQIGMLGSDGESLYALVSFLPPGAAEHEYETALIEVPCCGEAPRVVARDGLPVFGGPSEATFDGQDLLFVSQQLVLDVGPVASAAQIDPTSGAVTRVLENFRDTLLPSALLEGVLYFGRDRVIVGLAPGDCSSTTLVRRPQAERITAMTSDGSSLYWAETYVGLTGARIFRMQQGREPERIAQTALQVKWLGVDESHLYWREGEWTTGLVARVELR